MYLIKRGTSWNHLKLGKVSWNHLKPPGNYLKQDILYFLLKNLKKVTLMLHLSLYFTLKCFLGKFGPKNWSPPNWLQSGTSVFPMSNLMLIFSKYLSSIFLGANLVSKLEVLQINRNMVQGYIATWLLRY